MDRKAMARETMEIMKQGYYGPEVKNATEQKAEKKQIIIKEAMEQSVRRSILITPAEGMGQYFTSVFHAVLDHSKGQSRIKAFQESLEDSAI